MKRVLSVLSVVALSALGATPAVEAGTGGGVCVVTGKVKFSPPAAASAERTWYIGPATIDCHGIIYGLARILGSGPFEGSGSVAGLAAAGAPCTVDLGPGNLDYTIPTSMGPLRIIEPMMAGAGLFTTKTMTGTFQLLPTDGGDCASLPVTDATFGADAVFTRRTGSTLP